MAATSSLPSSALASSGPPVSEGASSVTPFQWRVYRLLNQIPKGKVTTYGAIARALNSSPRAVGNALRNNPFAPQVPCHRCVATSGYVNGYNGEIIEKNSFRRQGAASVNGKSHQSRARGAKAKLQNSSNNNNNNNNQSQQPAKAEAAGTNIRTKLDLLKDEGVNFDAKGMLQNRAKVLFDGPWVITE